MRQTLVRNLESTIVLLETTLTATVDGLEVAAESLDTASASADILAQTIQTTGKSIQDTLPLLDTLSELTSEDLPTMIQTAQEALDSAQASAKIVDSTLSFLTAIPFLPIQDYKPEVPLGEALGDVSTSLDPLPDALALMEEPLATTKGNLEQVIDQFDTISENIRDINASLVAAREVIGRYQGVVSSLQKQLERTKGSLASYANRLAWAITVILVWLGLTQVGLMMQGFEMLGMQLLKEKTPR
jgi:methyl-accepting chemotaxis protein